MTEQAVKLRISLTGPLSLPLQQRQLEICVAPYNNEQTARALIDSTIGHASTVRDWAKFELAFTNGPKTITLDALVTEIMLVIYRHQGWILRDFLDASSIQEDCPAYTLHLDFNHPSFTTAQAGPLGPTLPPTSSPSLAGSNGSGSKRKLSSKSFDSSNPAAAVSAKAAKLSKPKARKTLVELSRQYLPRDPVVFTIDREEMEAAHELATVKATAAVQQQEADLKLQQQPAMTAQFRANSIKSLTRQYLAESSRSDQLNSYTAIGVKEQPQQQVMFVSLEIMHGDSEHFNGPGCYGFKQARDAAAS